MEDAVMLLKAAAVIGALVWLWRSADRLKRRGPGQD